MGSMFKSSIGKSRGKNTKYFHCCATKRFRKNSMEGIRDEGGVWRTKQDKIGEVMVKYYKSLFASTKGSVPTSMLVCAYNDR